MTQASAAYSRESCAYCDGKGEVPEGQCKGCHGQGTVLVATPLIKCSFCAGKGRNGVSRCGRCRGAGWMNVRRQAAV